MRRGVRKELGSLWHYRGGGKGHLLLVGCRLVVHVSKAVVQVVVRVVVDLGGDDRAHEGRLVRHTWQGAPSSRRSRWEKSSGRVGGAEGRVAPTWAVRFHRLHIVNNVNYISRKKFIYINSQPSDATKSFLCVWITSKQQIYR